MKKLLVLLCFVFMIGCIYTHEKTLIVTEIHKGNEKNYEYLYTIEDAGDIGVIYYYTNTKFEVGDKVKFVKQEEDENNRN